MAGKLLSLCHELILRIDMVYKADAHSFLCTDHDVSAEDELFRDLLVGQTRKSLCAAEAGDDAQTSFRLTELGIVGSQSNVASHGNLAAAAQSEAVDCSDGGLFHILKALESNACKETESTAFGSSAVDHLGDVSAGNEGLLAGTGQNQNLNIGICFDLCKAGIELGSAFRALGRLIVTTAIPSSISTSKFLNSILFLLWICLDSLNILKVTLLFCHLG